MTPATLERTCEILLIEDNPGDVLLTREAIKKTGAATLVTAADGASAVELLYKRTSAGASLPDLIVLDLHLLCSHGHHVLAEIKKDPASRWIPVVVFSCSDSERDILRSYELGASCYVPKPFDLGGFNDVIGSIVQFWLKTAQLPRKRALAEQI